MVVVINPEVLCNREIGGKTVVFVLLKPRREATLRVVVDSTSLAIAPVPVTMTLKFKFGHNKVPPVRLTPQLMLPHVTGLDGSLAMINVSFLD